MTSASIRLSRGSRSPALDEFLPDVLDSAMAALDVAVVVTDSHGRVELWNGAAEELYGWSAAEAMGMLVQDLILPVSETEMADSIGEFLVNGGDWDGEFVCRRRNGTLLPIHLVDIPIRDVTGKIRAVVSVSGDLSDRLAAQREAEAVRALAEASTDAVLTVTGEEITSWSPAARRMLGWTADEVIGQSIWMLVPGEQITQCRLVLDAVRCGDAVDSHVSDRIAKDGTRVPVTIDVAPVFDAARQIWMGVVTMRDRRTRDEVIEAAIAAEVRFRTLLARSTEVVVVIDAEGKLRAISSSVEHTLGFVPEDLIGSDSTILVHPDDLTEVRAAIEAATTGTDLHPTVLYRRLSADGSYRWAEATLTNMLNDPVIAGIVVNARDVTEREDALATLRVSEGRLSAVVGRSSDVAMFFEGDGTIRWVSPAITEVFGIDPAGLIGGNGFDLIHPDDRERVLTEFLGGLVNTGDHVVVEFRLIDPTGEIHWVEEVATDLVDDPDVGFVVANLRDITDRKAAHAELARLALVDDLTDLPNRNALLEVIRVGTDRLAPGRTCGLIFFDIDDFCDVNDSLGHAAGDTLLIDIARRVAAALPVGATLSRFGDDQFAVFCEDVADLPGCLAVARTMRHTLDAPFVVEGREVFVAVSAGVAMSPPADVDTLLRRADTALYRAKKAGRGQTVVFETELGTESQQRLHYSGELRRAIERREIVPYYQPVIDLATGQAVAVEALARWIHPERGLIPPDTFIPIAEFTGMIGELGNQILEQACGDAAAWLARGTRLQVAVNASAVQLMDLSFPEQVSAALSASGLSSDQLTIELTETAALRDMSIALLTLGALRDQGIVLALDDFGTGYSSLSFLKRLPVNALKIDQSFVAGLGRSVEDDQIVTGVISLALALGFHVVAEGVETAEQAEFLRALGCQFGQGFLWSPAVPAVDVLATIERIGAVSDAADRPA